jgi:GNAT superfamily N-acetyltransferase
VPSRPAAVWWREEPIARAHDRRGFDCGVPELNAYLTRYARQNHALGVSKTFVAVPEEPPEAAGPVPVLGYYSLSAGELDHGRVPGGVTRKLPRSPLPVVRLARLAVDRRHQGAGLGGQLFLSAGERAFAVAEQAGVVALAIGAKDEDAAEWYARFGALRLLDDPLSLVLPLSTIEAALRAYKSAGSTG